MFHFLYCLSQYIRHRSSFHCSPKSSNDSTTHEKENFQYSLCRAVLSDITIRKLIKTQIVYACKLIRCFMRSRNKVVMFISSRFSSRSATRKSSSKSECQPSSSLLKVRRYTSNLQTEKNKLKLVSCSLQFLGFIVSFSEHLHFHKQD